MLEKTLQEYIDFGVFTLSNLVNISKLQSVDSHRILKSIIHAFSHPSWTILSLCANA